MFAYVSVAILCNSAPGFATALLASVWMALIPFSEEPWLREKLGAPYEEYAARVPRLSGVQAAAFLRVEPDWGWHGMRMDSGFSN